MKPIPLVSPRLAEFGVFEWETYDAIVELGRAAARGALSESAELPRG